VTYPMHNAAREVGIPDIWVQATGAIRTPSVPHDYYWGELSKEDMDEVMRQSRHSGWRSAIDAFSTRYSFLYDLTSGEDRIDFVKQVRPSAPIRLVLDVGSGLGQNAALLATQFPEATVVSLEYVPERCEFQRMRFEQDGLTNIVVINGSVLDVASLTCRFDLICIVGVLEWISATVDSKSPRQAQVDALSSVRGALATAGQVAVGIENRWGLNFFLGAIDHSGLRFTSLMPRRLASVYLRSRNKSYRSNRSSIRYDTYTYGRTGYRRLFESAGFTRTDVFATFPHYCKPTIVCPAVGPEISAALSSTTLVLPTRQRLARHLLRLLSPLRVSERVFPCYFVVGSD
jgi:SAM-dependent methyltransferase